MILKFNEFKLLLMKIEVYESLVKALKLGEEISVNCAGVPKGWEVNVSDCSVKAAVHDFISDLWSDGFSEGGDFSLTFHLKKDELIASYSTSPGWVTEMPFEEPSEEDYEDYEEYEIQRERLYEEFVEENSGSGTLEFIVDNGEVFY